MEQDTPARDVPVPAVPGDALRAAFGTLALLPVRQTAVGAAKVLVALALLGGAAAGAARTLAVVALLTVAVYAHNDLTDRAEDGVNHPGRTGAVQRRRRGLGAAVALAAALAVGFAATGGPDAVALALVPVLVGVCYNAPVLPGPGPDRLKEVLVVNTAATAAAWAVPVALLPAAFAGDAPGGAAALALGYVLARTYVASEFANVPDVAGDAAAGVATLPTVVGARRTRWALAGLTLLTGALLAAGAAAGALPAGTALALGPGLLLSAAVVVPRGDPLPVERLPALADLEFPVAAVALWLLV